MDRMRDQLFSSSRLAIDQDPTIGGCHDGDLLAQRFHRNAVTGDYTLEG